MYANILVPIDGSPLSIKALKEAIQLAKEQQAQLRVIHVLDVISFKWVNETYTGEPGIAEACRQDGRQILEDARMLANDQGIAVETELLEKSGERIAQTIIADACWWPADVIVMGTHGRKGLDRLLLGSVAEHVVRLAPVPVLLIPTT